MNTELDPVTITNGEPSPTGTERKDNIKIDNIFLQLLVFHNSDAENCIIVA